MALPGNASISRDSERKITTIAAGRLLGLTDRMVRYLIRQGVLRAVRNHGRRAWQVLRRDVIALKEQRDVAPFTSVFASTKIPRHGGEGTWGCYPPH